MPRRHRRIVDGIEVENQPFTPDEEKFADDSDLLESYKKLLNPTPKQTADVVKVLLERVL